MNAPFPTPDAIAIPQEFSACFAAQRAAYFALRSRATPSG